MKTVYKKNNSIHNQFNEWKAIQQNHRPLELAWCNNFFGTEPLQQQAARLREYGVNYIELRGTHYETNQPSDAAETLSILKTYGIQVSGITVLPAPDYDLCHSNELIRQKAIDRIRQEIEFANAVNAQFIDIVPSVLGQTKPHGEKDMFFCVQSLQSICKDLQAANVKGAIEAVNAFETYLINSIADTGLLLDQIDNIHLSYYNADLFHMLLSEAHIGESILRLSKRLLNIHICDNNRDSLGEGCLDIDTILMSLYLIGHNQAGRFITGEALPPGCDPSYAMNNSLDPKVNDRLVELTVKHVRESEQRILYGGVV